MKPRKYFPRSSTKPLKSPRFGVGGFAVTLSIGIVASFFSAIYVTRTLFMIYVSRRKASDPISI